MNHPTPVIGELYILHDKAQLANCLILPDHEPVGLGHVYQCVKHWEKHGVYEYHRVIMREERFYVQPSLAIAKDVNQPLLGQPLGHRPFKEYGKDHIAGEAHKVAGTYAALTAAIFANATHAFLETLVPGEILRLMSDDNGTPFPAGGVFVYDNYKGKLTLGRRHEDKLVKRKVAIKDLRPDQVTLASVVGAPAPQGEPRLLLRGDFVAILPFFERSLFREGPSRTHAPFAFVERVTKGECLRRKFHLVMQDVKGTIIRGVSEDVEVVHWLC